VAGKPRSIRPVLRWHGGKWLQAPKLLEYFPPHHIYTETFGGAASLLLRKWRSRGEVYNDLDQTLVHLFRVLRDRDQAAELIRLLEITPYAREEFVLAYEQTDDPVERARRTVVRSFMGFGSDGTAGRYPTGFRAAVTSGLKLPAREFATYPAALRRIVERLRGVVIENDDAIKIMRRFDRASTLHFVDPPYLLSTRSSGNRRRGAGPHVYEHELREEQHLELLATVKDLEGMVIICGYPSELYDDALAGWETVRFKAYADGAAPRTEVIWLNAAASAARRAGRMPHLRSADEPGPLFNAA
jgi:DNA adenine methylase